MASHLCFSTAQECGKNFPAQLRGRATSAMAPRNITPTGQGQVMTKRAYFPYHRNEKYPRNLCVDFRKLEYRSLQNYVKHHDINVRPDSTQAQLAVAVGRHFDHKRVNEDYVIGDFLHKCLQPGKPFGSGSDQFGMGFPSSSSPERNGSYGPGAKRNAGKGGNGSKKLDERRAGGGSLNNSAASKKRRAASGATPKGRAVLGEQVAMKHEKEGDDGTWILARVTHYNTQTDEYLCEDEDDGSEVLIDAEKIIRLQDDLKGLDKGDEVLAVFPDTTSFYRATIHKMPRPVDKDSGPPEIQVKFVDDEDESGRTPNRKMHPRFVIAVPSHQEDMGSRQKVKRARQ